MNGKRILIVDDVISTGGSLHALETLAAKSTGTVVGCCAALAEGDAAERTDIFFLEPLPLFAHYQDETQTCHFGPLLCRGRAVCGKHAAAGPGACGGTFAIAFIFKYSPPQQSSSAGTWCCSGALLVLRVQLCGVPPCAGAGRPDGDLYGYC